MRRRLRRILYALLILIAVVAIAIQVVLWTDYPRRLVLSLVQRELGLRVEARSLSTGWFGSTSLSEVTLSLPLAKESFLDVPTMNLRHTWLLPLIVTQHFELHAIDLEKPNLVVRRDVNGRWNLQDVAELVGKATAGTPEPGTKKRPPKLPRLKLVDGTVIIMEHDGRRATITPVNVSGYPDGLLVYRYDGSVPGPDAKPRMKLVGEVAPGEDWKHQFTLHAQPPAEWIKPWMAKPPDPLVINAQWTGVVSEEGLLTGRLELQDSKVQTIAARGRLAVQTGRGPTVFNPQDLRITDDLYGQVQLASGTMRLEGSTLRFERVRVAAAGGDAQLDGVADLSGRSATLNATWQELAGPVEVRHSGAFNLTIKTPLENRLEIAATIDTRGLVPHRGGWEGQIKIDGIGRNYSDIDWTIGFPRVDWNGRTQFQVNEFSARLTQRKDVLTLTELRWPAAQQLRVRRGDFNFSDHTWRLELSGRGTMNRSAPDPAPFDFKINTRGTLHAAHVPDDDPLLVHVGGTELRISGDFDAEKPKPLELSITLTHRPEDVIGPDVVPIRGTLIADARLAGTIDPLKLAAAGDLRAKNLVIKNKDFGNIKGKLSASVTGQQSVVEIGNMQMFGGTWRIDGFWPYSGSDTLLDSASDAFRIQIAAKNVQLHEIGDFLDAPLTGGSGNGTWTIDIPLPRWRRDTIAAHGKFDASAVVAKNFSADTVVGVVQLRGGTLRLAPVTFTKSDRQIAGQAVLSIETTTADPRKPTVKLAMQTWPIAMGDGVAAVSADASLAVNATGLVSATGPLTANVKFATTQAAIGDASIEGQIDGRVALLEKITLQGAGGLGSASGTAVIDADNPNLTTANLAWKEIDGARIGELVPQLAGLAGLYSGELVIGPATDPRAVEPLRLTLGLTPNNGKFRSVDVGPAKLSAFVNLSRSFVLQRMVLDELPSENRSTLAQEQELDRKNIPQEERPLAWNDIRLARGRIKLWARRGRHPSGEIQTHITADLFRLDLDQLVHGFKADADRMPGRLTGRAIVHGNPRDLAQVFGEGRIVLTDSDLAKVDALALLYNLIGLGSTPKTPDGHGALDFSLQSSTLTLNNLIYFNRGVEAWSSNLTIEDIWHIPKSPIRGYVVGSARPLSALKLPFLADVDQIMSVLQSNLTTVKIEGTLEKYKAEPATFGDVSDSLKRFMRGQVSAETGK